MWYCNVYPCLLEAGLVMPLALTDGVLVNMPQVKARKVPVHWLCLLAAPGTPNHHVNEAEPARWRPCREPRFPE